MKIICKRCKRTVAFSSGSLVQIKRGDNLISIVGKDYNILTNCAGHCGQQTAIMVEDSKILEDDLIIEKGDKDEEEEDNKEDNSDNGGGGEGDDKS